MPPADERPPEDPEEYQRILLDPFHISLDLEPDIFNDVLSSLGFEEALAGQADTFEEWMRIPEDFRAEPLIAGSS